MITDVHLLDFFLYFSLVKGLKNGSKLKVSDGISRFIMY